MKPGSWLFEEMLRRLQPGGAFLEPEELGLEGEEHLLKGEGFGLKPSELGLEGKAFALQGMRSEAEAGGFGVKWSSWIGPISGRMIHGLEIPAALLFLVMDRRAGGGDRKEEGVQGIEPFTHRAKLRATDGNHHSTKLRFRQVPDRFAPFCILCCYPAALLSRASYADPGAPRCRMAPKSLLPAGVRGDGGE